MDLFNINATSNSSEKSSTNKTILLLDWSNLMFRSLFLHKLYDGSTGYEREEDLKSFTHKFAVDICSIINSIKPAHTIICADSQDAWRKQILPGDDGYKGNREKDSSVNWNNIYKCSDDLLKLLEKQGISVASTEHAEADDIMAMVKEIVFEKFPEYSLIIVSSDADIRQLMDFNIANKQYCIVYNTVAKPSTKKKHLYVTQAFKDWLDAPEVCDIFFTDYTYDAQKHYIQEILADNPTIELTVENPEQILLNKILCGDDGDNVPSFYSYYKNGKLIRVTPKRSERMMAHIGARNLKELTERIDLFADAMKSVFKIDEVSVDCKERLNRQKLLVELDSHLFPQNIQDYKSTIEYDIRNIKLKPFQYMKADEVLKGTDYEGWGKRQALEAEVFKEFNRLTGNDKKKFVKDDVKRVENFSSNFNLDSLF